MSSKVLIKKSLQVLFLGTTITAKSLTLEALMITGTKKHLRDLFILNYFLKKSKKQLGLWKKTYLNSTIVDFDFD